MPVYDNSHLHNESMQLVFIACSMTLMGNTFSRCKSSEKDGQDKGGLPKSQKSAQGGLECNLISICFCFALFLNFFYLLVLKKNNLRGLLGWQHPGLGTTVTSCAFKSYISPRFNLSCPVRMCMAQWLSSLSMEYIDPWSVWQTWNITFKRVQNNALILFCFETWTENDRKWKHEATQPFLGTVKKTKP